MKFFTLLFPVLLTATACNNNTITAQPVKTKSPVVIELFTSEGCSSCPAAEKYLGALSKTDTNIILLSFHVDYWNRLGWTDTFSNRLFTERQYEYGNRLNLSTVYTPQALINGVKETTGSNAEKIKQFIVQTNENPQMLIGTVSAAINKNKISISAANHANNTDVLYEIFLVQKQVTTHVMAGENEGASLQHNNVVRSFITTENPNNIQLAWQPSFAKNNFEIVLVARDKKTFAVKDAVVKTL